MDTAPMPSTPAEYLHELQQRAASLAEHHIALRNQLAEATSAAMATAEAHQHWVDGPPLCDDPAALVDELVALNAARQYLQYLQELQALTRHSEKLGRSAERAYADGDPSIYLKEISDAVDAFTQATGYIIALEQLIDSGNLAGTALAQHGTSAAGRVHAAGTALRALLSSAVQRRLQECSWPPPLVVSGDGGAGTPGADWCGFSAAGDAVFGELQHLFVIQITLQRAIEHKEFATMGASDTPGSEGPVLWPAVELAAGVGVWLQHHFAQGLPTDRPDKPEWLFAAALKAARLCAPHAEAFQPCIDAHGLQPWYSMQLEAGRAVGTAALAPVLRGHVLPRLASMGDQPSLLHYADEAMRFERNFAALRGISSPLASEDDVPPGTAHAESAVEVLFEQDDWAEGWLASEFEDAVRQIDAALDAPDAWRPAADVAAQMAQLDLGAGGDAALSLSTSHDASQHEFFPPACSEVIVALIGSLARRGAYICRPAHKARFAKGVVQAALKAFRSRLVEMLVRAEQFDHLLDDAGLPKVGAAICAAHFVEHTLREPQATLLAALVGDDALAAALEREAGALSTLRRQWAYKLAKLSVDQFQAKFSTYRRSLAVFAAPGEEGLQPMGPSQALLPAAEGLQALLHALALHLDAVIFRDVWRAMALAVNYSMFNDVATEAVFSAFGAAHFEVDLDSVVAVFGRCTSRPAAHFKESKEACKLLLLAANDAAAAWRGLQGREAAGVLGAVGIRSLNAEQTASVLGRRADLNGASGA